MKQRHDIENPEGILSWDNALCEACWIGEESQWDFDDEEHEVLVSVRAPILVKGAPLEACSSCGAPTIIGLYVHRDPDLVNFPRYERDPQEGEGDDEGSAPGVQPAPVLEEEDGLTPLLLNLENPDPVLMNREPRV